MFYHEFPETLCSNRHLYFVDICRTIAKLISKYTARSGIHCALSEITTLKRPFLHEAYGGCLEYFFRVVCLIGIKFRVTMGLNSCYVILKYIVVLINLIFWVSFIDWFIVFTAVIQMPAPSLTSLASCFSVPYLICRFERKQN